MSRKAKVSYKEGLKILKEHGLDSIPGGGAEYLIKEIERRSVKINAAANMAGDSQNSSRTWHLFKRYYTLRAY